MRGRCSAGRCSAGCRWGWRRSPFSSSSGARDGAMAPRVWSWPSTRSRSAWARRWRAVRSTGSARHPCSAFARSPTRSSRGASSRSRCSMRASSSSPLSPRSPGSRCRRSRRRCASSGRVSPLTSCARPPTRSRPRSRRCSSSAARCSRPCSPPSARPRGSQRPGSRASSARPRRRSCRRCARHLGRERARTGLLGALASRGVRTVVLYAATVGVGFGSVELAMPAFAEAHGSRELGGLALASFSGGSLVGGLVAGMRPPRERAAALRARLVRDGRRPARPPACRVDPHALCPRFRRRAADRPDDRRALLPHRPLGAAGDRRGVRSPGSAPPSRSGSPRARCSRACSWTNGGSARRSPPEPPSPSSARCSAGHGAGRCSRLPPRPSRCLPCSPSARSSGDRAADF